MAAPGAVPAGLHFPPESNSALKDNGSDSEFSDLEPEPEATEPLMIEPDYISDGGVPVFKPSMKDFADFQRYIAAVNPYGMKSGIVKVIPPAEWVASQPQLDEAIKTIKIKKPIEQDIMGIGGTYRQANIVHQRLYNLPQWRQLCEQSEHQPPARRGERRAYRVKPTISTPKDKSSGTLSTEGTKRTGLPRGSRVTEADEKPVANQLPPPVEDAVSWPTLKTALQEEKRKVLEKSEKEEKNEANSNKQPKPKEKWVTVPYSTSVTFNTPMPTRGGHPVDKAAFKDFQYEFEGEDYSPERCEELERAYWRTLTYARPLYAANIPGTLFNNHTTAWNLTELESLLQLTNVPGIKTTYLCLGMWKATFAWDLTDFDLCSMDYLHFGAPKQWYSIAQGDARRFEVAMKTIWPTDAKNCDQFLRHKTFLISPAHLLREFNIEVNKITQHPGEFVITFPYGYHSGYNLGYNCAETVNFALDSWLEFGLVAKTCVCSEGQDSVRINVREIISEIKRKLRGDETEYEETDEEDEEEEDEKRPADLPTSPKSSGGTKGKAPRKIRIRIGGAARGAATGAASKMSDQSTREAARSSNEKGSHEISSKLPDLLHREPALSLHREAVHSDSSSEAESILSVAASGSSRSSITGEVESLAKQEFAKLLLDDEELKSMCVFAIESDKIGAEKFVRNFRRLLIQYSVGLKQEAWSKEQNDAAYLVRSQSRFIAHYVCNIIAPSTDPDRFDRLQNESGKLSRLQIQQAVNKHLEHLYATQEDKVVRDDGDEHVQEKPLADTESEIDSDIDDKPSDGEEESENNEVLSGLSRVKDFMVSSTAFSRFRGNIRGFVRQDFMSKVDSLIRKLTKVGSTDTKSESFSMLNRLARELTSIPPNEIWLLYEDSLGLSNQFKSMIEDLTLQTWEWWPLKPRRRPLSTGHARLFWNCPCGEVRWEDVPLPFATRIGKLLKQATDTLGTQAPASAPYSSSTTQSANSGAGIPLRHLAPPSIGLIRNQQGHTSHNNPSANPTTSIGSVTRTKATFQSLLVTYVLLGINVGDELCLAQIEVRDASHATDDYFFKELRCQYNALRGFMRRWFSIYRYAHCRFVKFEKIGENEIVPRDMDSLPDPSDLKYHYTPKPVEHMPPITEHEFRHRFYACYNRCSISKVMLLSAFHRCRKVCRQNQVLTRIPKKTWRLEENGDTREIFWGIHAVENISFLVVSIYHSLILVPGLIFWFLWLFVWGHSGDLQNSSVPFLALLACLPLFWFPLVVKTK